MLAFASIAVEQIVLAILEVSHNKIRARITLMLLKCMQVCDTYTNTI